VKTKHQAIHTIPDARFSTGDARWAAVQARDPAADGHFVYAVRTTGIYCRPSSSARLPKRENVEFFETAQAAEAAGYRASRRPAADRTAAAARRTALVADACRLIERAETMPNLGELAAQAGMSTQNSET
jgi:AraC family transcriptional regulator, regulatory protein of adaptative response / methylated-DNA-[protein]-cysteine methyltransferase